MPRFPTKEDLPSSVTLSITPPPPSQPTTNILLLLHGLGDTHASFTQLGRQLSLPETACISIQAPTLLPFDLGGFHWGDDMVFDEATGEMEMDTGFKLSTRMVLERVIKEGLIGKCGYKLRDIVIFGFGQGAMVSLNVAAELGKEELGGVVSVGGYLPQQAPLPTIDGGKCKTPVLVCKGNRNSKFSEAKVRRLKDTFAFIEVKEWNKNGDGMPSNREEMMPIMQFFARRLKSRRAIPEGAVEIS